VVGEGQPQGIPGHEVQCGVSTPPHREHAQGEVTGHDLSASAGQRRARGSRSGGQIQDAIPRLGIERIDHRTAPQPGLAQGKDVIGEVVPVGNIIEHRRHLIGAAIEVSGWHGPIVACPTGFDLPEWQGSRTLAAVVSSVTPLPAAEQSQFRARTIPVDLSEVGADLVDLLPDHDALAWVRNNDGLIGWGVTASWEFSGQERFSRAQRWWNRWLAEVDIDDPLDLPGTGPIAFASFTFDPASSGSTVVIPRVVVGRYQGQGFMTVIEDQVTTRAGNRTPEQTDPLTELRRRVRAPHDPGELTFTDGSLTPDAWMAAVAQVIERIGRGEIDKVVLARDVIAHTDNPVNIRHVLQRLAEDYPQCWTFCVAGMVGATPELLVRRIGSQVTSRVLAGTVKRRGDESEDAGLAAALLGSGKDLEEHEYAVRSVAQALSAHCADLDVPSRPGVLRLPNVAHLTTDITGQLVDSAPVLALAASLHPTAAVCGTPTERAFAVIRELEGMDRGRYAGPVGWWDSRGDGEFGIALRCAQVDPDRTTWRMFAGCGIVAGSQPQAELSESRAKLVPITEALS
jgi:menaquinone-specific isochorismate synthase